MKSNKQLKSIIIISMLIALGAVFSYFDGIISAAILSLMPAVAFFIPHFKFGFANIVILILIYNYSFKECVLAILLKSLLVGFIFGQGFTTFMFSFSGSVISFIVMWVLSKGIPSEKALIFISAMGGFAHTCGQLAASFIVLSPADFQGFILYSPLFILSGFITGALVGILTKKVNASVMNHLQDN